MPISSQPSGRRGRRSPPLLDRASPLRTSHLRDPVGPQIHFRQRILHRRAGRSRPAPIRSRSGCDTSPSRATSRRSRRRPRRPAGSRGRPGARQTRRRRYRHRPRLCLFAARRHHRRDRRRGRGRSAEPATVLGRAWSVAHDCGLIVNPEALRRTIEGNVVQATSRADPGGGDVRPAQCDAASTG